MSSGEETVRACRGSGLLKAVLQLALRGSSGAVPSVCHQTMQWRGPHVAQGLLAAQPVPDFLPHPGHMLL